MDADLLLTWMSEVGSGDVRDLRQRVAWAARAADRSPKPYETGRWLRDISALGHAEVDWHGGTWAIAPAVAALLPATGGTAVLAGSRRVGLIDRLEELVAVHVETPASSSRRPAARAVDRLRPSGQSVETSATRWRRLMYVTSDARAEHRAGPSPDRARSSCRTAQREENQPSTFRQALTSVRFYSGLPAGDGLCRISVFGRPSYRYRSERHAGTTPTTPPASCLTAPTGASTSCASDQSAPPTAKRSAQCSSTRARRCHRCRPGRWCSAAGCPRSSANVRPHRDLPQCPQGHRRCWWQDPSARQRRSSSPDTSGGIDGFPRSRGAPRAGRHGHVRPPSGGVLPVLRHAVRAGRRAAAAGAPGALRPRQRRLPAAPDRAAAGVRHRRPRRSPSPPPLPARHRSWPTSPPAA